MIKFLQTVGILFFLIYSVQLSAQQIKPTPLTYSSTFIFEGYTQEELYIRAKKWFSEQLQDPSSIIEVEKEGEGQLIAKASFGYSDPRIEYGTEYNTLNGLVQYTIKLTVRKERVKLTLTDFIHRAFPYGSKGIRNSLGLITTANTYEGKLYGYNAAEKKTAWNNIKLTIEEISNNLLESVKRSVSYKPDNQ